MPLEKFLDTINKLAAIQDKKLYVGIQGKEASEQHRGDEPGVTVGEVAFKNYYGAPGVPARPWLRVAALEHSRTFGLAAQKAISAVTKRGADVDTALGLVGALMVGKVQETISDGVPPPNSAKTIKGKGSSKPLIDTGHLRQAHTWQIKNQR